MTRPGLFVDTAAWVALESSSDVRHGAARAFATGPGRGYQWLTTNWVVAETLTFLRRRASHAQALRFGDRIHDSRLLTIVTIDDDHERRAWEIFRRYADKDFSKVDCTSFAAMERAGVAAAFTFDDHFAQYGWIVLPGAGPPGQAKPVR